MKKCDQKIGLNTEMEGPMNINQSERTENKSVVLDRSIPLNENKNTFEELKCKIISTKLLIGGVQFQF